MGSKDWKKDLVHKLVHLLQPYALLRNSTPTWDLEQYLALLHSFSQLSESREADERALLGHQFELSQLLKEKQLNDLQCSELAATLPALIGLPGLSFMSTALVDFFSNSPSHQHLLMNLLFTTQISTLSEKGLEEYLAKLQLTEIAPEQCHAFINSCAVRFASVRPHEMKTMICILRQLTTRNHQFMKQFKEENVSPYSLSGAPTTSALWNTLAEMVIQLFQSQPMSTSVELHGTIASVLRWLFDLCAPLGHAMLDKLWSILAQVIIPVVPPAPHHVNSTNSGTQEIHSALHQIAAELPWGKARFLLYDQNALPLMNQVLFRMVPFVSVLFGRLDWDSFMNRLSSSRNKAAITAFGLKYLRLMTLVNLFGPECLSARQRVRTTPEFASQGIPTDQGTPFLPWSMVDYTAFASVFSGGLMKQALQSGWVRENPTGSLLENFFALRTIAVEMNHIEAAVACAREIASVLFTPFEYAPGSYWFLTLPAHTSLLTGALIPLTQHFTAENRETREMVLSIMSCMVQNAWVTPCSVSSSISNLGQLPYYPGMPERAAQDLGRLFVEKMRGLVLEFCRAATPALALHIIRVVPLPDFHSETPQMPPTLWVEVVEASLRSYFALGEQSGMARPSESLNISIPDRLDLIDVCIQDQAGCTLLVILYQWEREFSAQWGQNEPYPSLMFDKALLFQPAPYRLFEHFLFWFFILDLVKDPRFHPVVSQAESWKLLKHLKATAQQGDDFLVLGAKTTEVFFYRMIREKRKDGTSNERANQALQEQIQKLLQLRTKPQYEKYTTFWKEVPNILEPSFTLKAFKLMLLAHLVPDATPLAGTLFM